ncbi:hypothetical protein HPB50_024203 [Hyalomma asiaticum]|uniref:Uncharacterized protein n=1 Tax=Hyalomma asiaticum TaxID=266040 RepID=A0ACB7SUX2_HYAAI|nr:hypothetical protein HPB50_024203 [Hyalomma asiaticum]
MRAESCSIARAPGRTRQQESERAADNCVPPRAVIAGPGHRGVRSGGAVRLADRPAGRSGRMPPLGPRACCCSRDNKRRRLRRRRNR